MKNYNYFVYIITNTHNTVLYTGVTSDLEGRMWEHKNKAYRGFSYSYNCNKLVYYEYFESIDSAIAREKQIKAGSRSKKLLLINSVNPNWEDLSAKEKSIE